MNIKIKIFSHICKNEVSNLYFILNMYNNFSIDVIFVPYLISFNHYSTRNISLSLQLSGQVLSVELFKVVSQANHYAWVVLTIFGYGISYMSVIFFFNTSFFSFYYFIIAHTHSNSKILSFEFWWYFQWYTYVDMVIIIIDVF